MSLPKMSLLRACSDILARIEEGYALPGLHVNFTKREKTAQFNGLFVGDGLREMLERKDSYAVDRVFPPTAPFTDSTLTFKGRCELSRLKVQYRYLVNKVQIDKREKAWLDGELMLLRSEIEEFKPVVERVFVSHCPFRLRAVKFHLLNHLVEDLKRLEIISFTEARPF